MYFQVKMYCGNGPVSGARSCPTSEILKGCCVSIADDALRMALHRHITAFVSDNWSSLIMTQDGIANLKEGLEEAFADLGISFQLKQVNDNLVLVSSSNHSCLEAYTLTNRWGKATTLVLNLWKWW